MRTQEKRATRFRSIQTSLLFVIVPAVIISMAVLSLMGYLSSKAIIQTSAGTEMSQCLSVAMGSIEMSLSNNRMVAETMARGVEAVQRQAVKGEQTASDWDAEHRPAPPHPPGYHTENRGRKPVCGDPAQFQI